MSGENGMIFFLEQLAGLDVTGVRKVLTKYYHFSDSRARELASRRGLVELRTKRCWLKNSQSFSGFVTLFCACTYICSQAYLSFPYSLPNQYRITC